MKKALYIATFLAGVLLAMSTPVGAQVSGSLWRLSGGELFPVVNTWSVTLPYLGGGPGSPCVNVNSSGDLGTTTCGSGSGTVTSITTSNGVTGGPITTTGNISLLSYIATSSADVDSDLAYWTTSSGNPAKLASVATTSVSCSGSVSCGAFTVIGSSPVTITASASASPIATSTHETAGEVPYWTSTSGTPATLGEVSTTSLGVTGPITFSGTLGSQLGGASGTFGCASCSTFAYPFTPSTNYSVTTSSTSTPIWDTAGIFASSTSEFVYASTTALTAKGTIYADNFYDTSAAGSSCLGDSSGIIENGNCVASLSSSGSTLTISSPTGNVNADINLAHSNSWSVLQSFSNSTSTLLSAGTIWDTGVAAGIALVSGSGPTAGLIGSTPSPLGTIYGGTNSTALGLNSLMWYNGTSILATSSSPLTVSSLIATSSSLTNYFLGSVGVASTTPFSALSVGTGTASSSITVAEYKYGAGSNAATSTTQNIDCNAANQIAEPIGASAMTFTLINLTPGKSCRVVVQNGGGTASTVTWKVGEGIIVWSGGTAPTQTTTANKYDVYSFITTMGSSTMETLGATTQNF